MDDLSGLEWAPSADLKKPPPMNSMFSDLRPTPPVSGRSTPFSGRSAPSNPPSKSTTPANDNFASLVPFGSATSGKTLSLLEQQRQLAEQKAREEAEKKAQLDAQYGGSNARFWDDLEKIGRTPSRTPGFAADGRRQLLPQQHPVGKESVLGPSRRSQSETQSSLNDGDDILAAFNASTPVDASTHFPIPSSIASPSISRSLKFSDSNRGGSTVHETGLAVMEDDDPFGLGQMQTQRAPQGRNLKEEQNNNDILGLLAKPVLKFPRQEPQEKLSTSRRSPSPSESKSPRDHSIAELVDMGFSVDKARQALATTESGTDVQAAVSWLLNQAHSESRRQAKGGNWQAADGQLLNGRHERSPDRRSVQWRDLSTSTIPGGKGDSRVPATTDWDAAQPAAGFGNNLLKTANSLWKSGTKKMQQAVQEFNVAPDPTQPRWMREIGTSSERQPARFQERNLGFRQQASQTKHSLMQTADITDEALMLESEKLRSTTPLQRKDPEAVEEPKRFRSQPPAIRQFRESYPAKPAALREEQKHTTTAATSRLARLATEEQPQAYPSPARRRKPTAKPRVSATHPDLFEDSSITSQETRPATLPSKQPRSEKPTPIRVLPKAPPRLIPQVSPSALISSHEHRERGSSAFKRGDYSAAHASYSTALSLLPESHPVRIIILSNRALTSLKIGNPKSAISDADNVISIIGSSRGESEKIDLGGGMPNKDMREFFGKALVRKAEALEQLERWIEATKVWQEAVESGHGGNTSIQGRNRCEKASRVGGDGSGTPTALLSSRTVQSRPRSQPPKKAVPQVTVLNKPGEAVARLRAANEAAERADDEKFALADIVDSRLTAWKGGKQDNLRALLASLDSVLWPEAEWKKISLADLVLPNKVKVQYMKGIAKVHPDKIPVNATTEQKMIASAVFTILNEAWDKFKRKNGL